MAKRVYVWFVEPLDGSNTNNVLRRELTMFGRKVPCGDGKKHDLWNCSWDFVLKLKKCKSDLGLDFKIFNRCGNGQIREFKFPYLRKRKKQSRI